ncbi:MAG: type II toxin-antitoxin system PemK/MazF family toxin [Nanoarchaeota archaeon]|nr:type II toxin-antitoxin system PemK/MazF family toxin [Nanoarchaeota archaeon]
MEKFVKGDVVVIPFLFSDLSASRKRPALVVADLQGYDYILCQITSQARKDKYSVILYNNDFAGGNLNVVSLIRPNRLFTADKSLIERKAGSLKKKKVNKIINDICGILQA